MAQSVLPGFASNSVTGFFWTPQKRQTFNTRPQDKKQECVNERAKKFTH